MSPSRKTSEEECGFKWGKKKGIGGKKKEVQFYGSFTFDGVEYSLYDNVYVHKEDEPEPYIGKLVKIWEQPQEKKKVKLLWFFRPIELLNFLEDGTYLENELFLATGTGLGLANVNPLEAIAGKCRVVCTSNDSRNRQPSPEELRTADYIFYRTFNVGTYTISEKIDDKVVDVEARFLLNRECELQSSDVRVEKEVIDNVAGSNVELRRCPELNTEGAFLNGVVDDKAGPSMLKKDESLKISVNQDSLSVKDIGADSGAKTMEIEVRGDLQDSVLLSRKKLSHPLTDSGMDEVDAGMPISKVEGKNLKISEDLGLDDKPSKKARIDSSVKLPEKHKAGPSMLKKDESTKISVNQDSLLVKDLGADSGAKTTEIEVPGVLQESVPLSKKKLSHPRTESRMDEADAGMPISKVVDKNLKISEDLHLDDKLAKKARIDSSVKLPVKHNNLSLAPNDDKKQSIVQKEEKAVENDVLQVPGTVVCDDDGKKSKPSKDLPRPDKGSFKKVKPDEKASKNSNSTVAKTKAVDAAEENVISEGQVMDVTRKPDTDRSRWFKEIEWDERIKDAHEKGTIVLLENLDPTYSSSEIEDIIWSGFRESCSAKVIPQTAISSPHSGQASVVFKSRDAADTAIKKLSEGCLMLPNGRPLVASYGTPPVPHGNASTYLGHLDVDKKKSQRAEQRDAVSTSHYSQPNTIEYDMAMEWCRLQKSSEKMWENLYKQHGANLEKLKVKLKSKLV